MLLAQQRAISICCAFLLVRVVESSEDAYKYVAMFFAVVFSGKKAF